MPWEDSDERGGVQGQGTWLCRGYSGLGNARWIGILEYWSISKWVLFLSCGVSGSPLWVLHLLGSREGKGTGTLGAFLFWIPCLLLKHSLRINFECTTSTCSNKELSNMSTSFYAHAISPSPYPSMHHLQRKVHMLHPLVDTTCTNHINPLHHKPLHVLLRQPPTHLYQKLPLLLQYRLPIPIHTRWPSTKSALEPLDRAAQLLPRREIIQHHHVRARSDGFHGLGLALALHLDLDGEAAGGLGGADGARDVAAAGPDVVVLEHDHGGEVVAVGVGAADGEGVFLGDAEARGGFAGAGEGGRRGGVLAEEVEEGGCPVGRVRGIV